MKPRRRIMVVDDELVPRRAFCRIVEQAGFETVAAASGHEALDILGAAKSGWDLIILDEALGDSSGLDLLGRMRDDALGKDTQVLICSAAPLSEAQRLRARALGVGRFLRKPVGNAEFLAAVRAALARSYRPD